MTIRKFIVIKLHATFDKLNRTHNKSINQARKSPILNPINQAQMFFLADLLIELIATEHNGINNRDRNKRVVDPIE